MSNPDSDKKPPYEKPVAMDLAGIDKGSGACSPGSGDPSCTPGANAGLDCNLGPGVPI
jgi:hypothetical protein